MRKTLGALVLVSVTLAGTGCKKASPLVGKWNVTQGQASTEVEFKPESAFTMAIKLGTIEFDLSGDYKLDGENLTLTLKDVNVPKLSATQQAQAKATFASQMGRAQTMTAKFPTDDQLVLTSTGNGLGMLGKSNTLTRVKDAK